MSEIKVGDKVEWFDERLKVTNVRPKTVDMVYADDGTPSQHMINVPKTEILSKDDKFIWNHEDFFQVDE